MRPLLVAMLAMAVPALASAQGTALDKIRSDKTVTMAYRSNALPFSFKDPNGQPAGYTVELCKRVAESMASRLNIPDLRVRWVEATSQNRFTLVEKGEVDMECGASTATLKRMERVDFSSYVFIDSTGVLVTTASGAKSFTDLAGKRIAVIAGSTNVDAVARALRLSGIQAQVTEFASRELALEALETGKADAFASDKILLEGLSGKVKDASKYRLLRDDLSVEPYAITLPRGDSALRLEVNRALSRIFGSRAIQQIFERTFGAGVEPSPLLLAVYTIGQIPE
ncbi:MAG: amino acid ABC transporter substrate-binding protein [Burkholderiales bacterium]|nr:amino acid ABC transporter substrate-binding protein [Burkholderiales bacterium]